MLFIVPLYDIIIKISLRKENVNIFYAVSREYYGVRGSPLYEHRDVCPAMRTNIYFLLAFL